MRRKQLQPYSDRATIFTEAFQPPTVRARINLTSLHGANSIDAQSKTKIRVAILGTGNIGTNLLIKAMRSNVLECALFVGRSLRSDGAESQQLGVPISDRGVYAIVQ